MGDTIILRLLTTSEPVSMSKHGRMVVGTAVGICLFASFACCIWLLLQVVLFFDGIGGWYEGMRETAVSHATANGYKVEGSLTQFIREPDGIGACEVEFQFRDFAALPANRQVSIRLRRPWVMAGWEVTGMTTEDEK